VCACADAYGLYPCPVCPVVPIFFFQWFRENVIGTERDKAKRDRTK